MILWTFGLIMVMFGLIGIGCCYLESDNAMLAIMMLVIGLGACMLDFQPASIVTFYSLPWVG